MENLLAITLSIHSFQPIAQCYKQRTAQKASLQSIQPLCKIWNAQSSIIDLKVGVSLSHGV